MTTCTGCGARFEPGDRSCIRCGLARHRPPTAEQILAVATDDSSSKLDAPEPSDDRPADLPDDLRAAATRRRWYAPALVALGLVATVAAIVVTRSPGEPPTVRSLGRGLSAELPDISSRSPALRWTVDLGGDSRLLGAAEHAGRVAVLSSPRFDAGPLTLRVVDSVTGRTLWTQDVPVETVGRWVMNNDVVLIGGRDASAHGAVTALNSSDGRQLWSKVLSTRSTAEPYLDAAEPDLAFLQGPDLLVAVGVTDGRERWSTASEQSSFADSVVVVRAAGVVRAIDRRSGRERWSVRAEAMWSSGRRVLAEAGGAVVAFDDSGRRLWTWATGSDHIDGIDGIVDLGDDRLFVSGHGDALIVSSIDGRVIRHLPKGSTTSVGNGISTRIVVQTLTGLDVVDPSATGSPTPAALVETVGPVEFGRSALVTVVGNTTVTRRLAAYRIDDLTPIWSIGVGTPGRVPAVSSVGSVTLVFDDLRTLLAYR